MALDVYRTGRAYTISEAARLASTSPQNVRRWLQGYEHDAHRMTPVFGNARDTKALSFLELAEIIVVARFRKYGIKLNRVREAHALVKTELPDFPYPFASRKMSTVGGHILHAFDVSHPKYGVQTLAISVAQGQYVLPALVQEALYLFEFDSQDGMATRLYPAGKNVHIVVDPHFAGGRLAVENTGITVAGIIRRFRDGKQSIRFIAHDLALSKGVIEEAIRFADAA